MRNERPEFDAELKHIAEYVMSPQHFSHHARETARWVLLDAMGCALSALDYPECRKLLGPVVPGTVVPLGTRVPGTAFVLDPVKAAFDMGALIRWLDYNDTWLAAEWGHPSDNLGAILAVADHLDQVRRQRGDPPIVLSDLLDLVIKAHEIQGVLALNHAFNQVGLDHVILVKLASTAVVTALYGGNESDIVSALSQVFVDGQSLRTYRHAPNTGSRKSWAAGDAASRAVRLSMITLSGEPGYPTALSAPRWGFYDVSFKGQPFRFERSLGSYVMEHVLFKIAYPAEFHAQTAVECAMALYPEVHHRLGSVERIEIQTQEPAVRIISKQGPLHNSADRDHCLQYMVAVPLIAGRLEARDYQDQMASDPRIDVLRGKMVVHENPAYTQMYYDPQQRAIPNAIQVFFTDGSHTERVEVCYPIGHQKRRAEGLPLLQQKFEHHVRGYFPQKQASHLLRMSESFENMSDMRVSDWMAAWVFPFAG